MAQDTLKHFRGPGKTAFWNARPQHWMDRVGIVFQPQQKTPEVPARALADFAANYLDIRSPLLTYLIPNGDHSRTGANSLLGKWSSAVQKHMGADTLLSKRSVCPCALLKGSPRTESGKPPEERLSSGVVHLRCMALGMVSLLPRKG